MNDEKLIELSMLATPLYQYFVQNYDKRYSIIIDSDGVRIEGTVAFTPVAETKERSK